MSASPTMTATAAAPEICDYCVIGAGATGMAFVDSFLQGLLLHERTTTSSTSKPSPLKIVLMDQHAAPGGQWNDSYSFVQLHQPSAMYGVESTPLEPSGHSAKEEKHRATRQEILDYYADLVKKWENPSSSNDSPSSVSFQFIGGITFDFDCSQSNDEDGQLYRYQIKTDSASNNNHSTIKVTQRLVDARHLQPDLPVSTAPKFTYDPTKINCVPVNDIVAEEVAKDQYFVVIGAGKTGMDAIVYLLTQRNIPTSNIMWIVPHDPWITARENIGNCMEFLHDVTQSKQHDLRSTDIVQHTFQLWERQGKIYRLFDGGAVPTKFNDATLSKAELELIRSLPPQQVIRGQGRVSNIDPDTGALMLQNGSAVTLPWSADADALSKTTYVHCSAGAFNYTKQTGVGVPVFDTAQKTITIQDVYGTPGFCFVGSILGKLESISVLDDSQKNALCRAPKPSPAPSDALGPSGGDVGGLSEDHGFVQRMCNLRRWLQTPQLRDWLVGHRLFNLGHYSTAEDIEKLVNETWVVLKEAGLVVDE